MAWDCTTAMYAIGRPEPRYDGGSSDWDSGSPKYPQLPLVLLVSNRILLLSNEWKGAEVVLTGYRILVAWCHLATMAIFKQWLLFTGDHSKSILLLAYDCSYNQARSNDMMEAFEMVFLILPPPCLVRIIDQPVAIGPRRTSYVLYDKYQRVWPMTLVPSFSDETHRSWQSLDTIIVTIRSM